MAVDVALERRIQTSVQLSLESSKGLQEIPHKIQDPGILIHPQQEHHPYRVETEIQPLGRILVRTQVEVGQNLLTYVVSLHWLHPIQESPHDGLLSQTLESQKIYATRILQLLTLNPTHL